MGELLVKVDTVPELVEALRAYLDAKNVDAWCRVWVHVSFNTGKAGCELKINGMAESLSYGDATRKKLSSKIDVTGATPQIVYDKIVGMVETDLRPTSQRMSDERGLTKVF